MEFSADIQAYAQAVVAQHGSPCYMYLPHIIEQQINTLRESCPGFEPRYAVKSNPNPWLLRWLKDKITTLDVSSAGEITLALSCGWPGKDLEFTGPAKTRKDILIALKANIGSIVVEDLSEAELIQAVATELGVEARLLIRIAPSGSEEKFGIRLAGRATQFGVEMEQMPELLTYCKSASALNLAGLHIYSGSQCLDDDALAKHFDYLWAVFQEVMDLFGEPIEELVFGAGMGIPYHDADPELTLDALAKSCRAIGAQLSSNHSQITPYIELGRYLVGPAGYFLTEVIRIKQSKGKNIAICNGGMNHNLAACGHLGGIGHRHYSMINASSNSDQVETYKVVGPLCTAIDTLAQRVDLPRVTAGDILAISCAGSYGPSSSPLYFISHEPPKEVVLELIDGSLQQKDCTWLAINEYGSTPAE